MGRHCGRYRFLHTNGWIWYLYYLEENLTYAVRNGYLKKRCLLYSNSIPVGYLGIKANLGGGLLDERTTLPPSLLITWGRSPAQMWPSLSPSPKTQTTPSARGKMREMEEKYEAEHEGAGNAETTSDIMPIHAHFDVKDTSRRNDVDLVNQMGLRVRLTGWFNWKKTHFATHGI